MVLWLASTAPILSGENALDSNPDLAILKLLKKYLILLFLPKKYNEYEVRKYT